MRDNAAPQWATHMIEIGMTDPDYTDRALEIFEYARLRNPRDEHETVVYVYAHDLDHMISHLVEIATMSKVEWCHPHSKDEQNSNYDTVVWSWIE